MRSWLALASTAALNVSLGPPRPATTAVSLRMRCGGTYPRFLVTWPEVPDPRGVISPMPLYMVAGWAGRLAACLGAAGSGWLCRSACLGMMDR